MLKMGRHIRPAPHYKLIVSREEGENNFLMGYKKQYPSIKITSHSGPLTLIDGTPSDEDLIYAAKIAGRFSKGRMEDEMTVEITKPGGVTTTHTIKPMRPEEVDQKWYI